MGGERDMQVGWPMYNGDGGWGKRQADSVGKCKKENNTRGKYMVKRTATRSLALLCRVTMFREEVLVVEPERVVVVVRVDEGNGDGNGCTRAR